MTRILLCAFTSLVIIVANCLPRVVLAQGRTVSASEFISHGAVADGISYFTIDSAMLAKVFTANGHLELTGFPGGGSEIISLDLKPAHSPIDATTQFVEGSLSGDHFLEAPSFVVYQGVVSGEPHSRVTLTVFSGQLLCSIVRESGEQYVFGPAKNSPSTSAHVFMRESKLLSTTTFQPFKCLTDDMTQAVSELAPSNGIATAESIQAAPGNSLLQADIAVEADTCFYRAAGNNTPLVAGYIASLFAMCSAIYEDEANVTFHLTNVRLWKDTDPYNVKGNAYNMDAVVRPYWRSHYQSVPRDLAHILTSIGYGGGGYGWFSLCDTTLSYSYSSPQTGHAYPTFAFTYDAYIVSHEIGHNFSLRHGHDCWWDPPLDTCWTKDDTITRRDGSGNKLGQLVYGDACCSLPITPRPSAGTIMSYCPNANYILANADFSKYTIDMTFSKRGGDSIRKFAALAPCITPPTNPVVILTNPRGSATYRGDTTVAVTWRYAGVDTVALGYSTDGGGTWSPITSAIPASWGSIQWKVPNVASQKMLVKVFDVARDTVADTSLLFFTVTKTADVAATISGASTSIISFSLVPDPAGDMLRIVPSETIVNLKSEILDERGVVLQSMSGNANASSGFSVGLSTLPAGTYFLHIASPVERVISFTHYQ